MDYGLIFFVEAHASDLSRGLKHTLHPIRCTLSMHMNKTIVSGVTVVLRDRRVLPGLKVQSTRLPYSPQSHNNGSEYMNAKVHG